MKSAIFAILVSLGTFSQASAQIEVYSDGSDGPLNPPATVEIDLSLAPTGNWDDPGSGAGNSATGIYDPDLWAVVFKYSSVNIASNVTLTFKNHPSGAPVVWLVDGNVLILGTVSLNGSVSANVAGTQAGAGPGGFRGGTVRGSALSQGSTGFGPGGGRYNAPPGGGSYATIGGNGGGISYGNARVLPLIGGSGGGSNSGSNSSYAGGGGGGAILIAASGTVTISGVVRANGGSATTDCNHAGGGAGGGIRLIANTIGGSAAGLSARPGCEASNSSGGFGRIRIECNTNNLTGSSSPNFTQMFPIPNNVAEIWPPANAPSVRVATIAGQPVPLDPTSRFTPPGDVLLNLTTPPVVEVVATNVPLDWIVAVQATLRSGAAYSTPCTLTVGNSTASTWTATLNALPVQDYVALQARAYKP